MIQKSNLRLSLDFRLLVFAIRWEGMMLVF
nr:MAG TPA: hypothetical protein [Caudoviricetes sp.]